MSACLSVWPRLHAGTFTCLAECMYRATGCWPQTGVARLWLIVIKLLLFTVIVNILFELVHCYFVFFCSFIILLTFICTICSDNSEANQIHWEE